ncbi:hypothetical protein BCR44DRAFT_1446440 [Catenaria anguillulae PL171]|uniref:Uncharacterized protein n=1 Tax=Catenaria anguillulae PL171 TaxID=765915 RepID=A0A1Y2HAN5_9FUNG|nr:hypothetical protein BCR44DRAFT_1446440 [Catenaria anguillulae PL171]
MPLSLRCTTRRCFLSSPDTSSSRWPASAVARYDHVSLQPDPIPWSGLGLMQRATKQRCHP